MRILAVLNRDGGTFKTTDMNAYVSLAPDIFSAHGHGLETHVVRGPELTAALDHAIGERPDAVLAGGGDGTISAAADRCWRANVPLGVIPAGTMNLFARSLAIPPNPTDALEALASGTIRAVDIATANGEPFVHQYSVGFHARMVRLRDRMEFGSRIGKVIASTRALVATIIDPPTFPIRFRLGEATLETRLVSTVSVSNNLFGEGHLPYADDPDAGMLGVYMHPRIRMLEGFILAWKAARGRLSEVENLEISSSGRVVLEFPRWRRSAVAVMDGEIRPLAPRVELVSRAGELLVLAPVK